MSIALWRTVRGGLLALGLTAASVCAGQTDALAQGKTRLTVYTALDTDQLAAFKKAAEADVPNIHSAMIAWLLVAAHLRSFLIICSSGSRSA